MRSIWKTRFVIFLVVLFGSFPALAADSETVPLVIQGNVVEVGSGLDRKTVSETLGRVLSPEFLSVSTPERIQYDYFPSDGAAPMTVLFDFDEKGLFTQAIVDANRKEDNPVARDLVAWLESHAGAGKKVGDGAVWKYAGLSFTLTELLEAGEDSIYQLLIEKQ